MNFFKRAYTVRRYGQKIWENGLCESPFEDIQLPLDIQNRSHRSSEDLSGQSETGSLTVYSDSPLYPARPEQQMDADRLLYMGRWYECTSCAYWGNTILRHWQAEFRLAEGGGEDANE